VWNSRQTKVFTKISHLTIHIDAIDKWIRLTTCSDEKEASSKWRCSFSQNTIWSY